MLAVRLGSRADSTWRSSAADPLHPLHQDGTLALTGGGRRGAERGASCDSHTVGPSPSFARGKHNAVGAGPQLPRTQLWKRFYGAFPSADEHASGRRSERFWSGRIGQKRRRAGPILRDSRTHRRGRTLQMGPGSQLLVGGPLPVTRSRQDRGSRVCTLSTGFRWAKCSRHSSPATRPALIPWNCLGPFHRSLGPKSGAGVPEWAQAGAWRNRRDVPWPKGSHPPGEAGLARLVHFVH
jgi:hypothetical protein